jgi:DNA-binding beta-propeller fold protein YncE
VICSIGAHLHIRISCNDAKCGEGVSGWYPYQLVITEDRYGNQSYVRFNRETGVLDAPLDEDGKWAILSPPTTPPTYSAYQFEMDKKGHIIVFEPDTGKVWKANGKQYSIQSTSSGTQNRPIFEPGSIHF